METYATYTKASDKLNLVLTGGYSFQQQNFESHTFTAGDFPGTEINYVDAIEYAQDLLNAGLIGANSDKSPDQLIAAYFGRVNLTLNNNLFLNASIRREGSNKFAGDNKWGTFPAVGIGTDLNEYLNFDGVNQLKARLSYGVTGNLPSQYGLTQNIYPFGWAGGGTTGGTTFRSSLANPDLKWEEKSETNFGLDLNTDRLTASLDIYSQTSKDFIILRALDATENNGYSSQWDNAGTMTSKGFELALNYDVTDNYNTGIVLSRNKTVLDEYVSDAQVFGNMGSPGQNSTFAIRVKQGEEIGQIWGPVYDGTTTNGSQNFVDVNGDGVLNIDQGNALNEDVDFQVLGKGTPDFELGWTNQLTLGEYTINAFFRGAFGHSLVNSFRVFYEPRVGSQKSYNYVNTEYATDEITNAQFSSYYVEKADFFRLDNLTISRPLNLNSDAFKSVTVSLNAQNLFTLTNYSGTDPEPALVDIEDNGNPLAPGMDRRNSYYTARSFTLGVNINL